VTRLRKMMLEELQRRNYSAITTRNYLRVVSDFAKHFGKSPDKLGPNELRTYQAYLLTELKLTPGTVVNRVAALRFFFVKTLKRHQFREFLPYPRDRRRLPTVLMPDASLAVPHDDQRQGKRGRDQQVSACLRRKPRRPMNGSRVRSHIRHHPVRFLAANTLGRLSPPCRGHATNRHSKPSRPCSTTRRIRAPSRQCRADVLPVDATGLAARFLLSERIQCVSV
jgi:hypothetical protein